MRSLPAKWIWSFVVVIVAGVCFCMLVFVASATARLRRPVQIQNSAVCNNNNIMHVWAGHYLSERGINTTNTATPYIINWLGFIYIHSYTYFVCLLARCVYAMHLYRPYRRKSPCQTQHYILFAGWNVCRFINGHDIKIICYFARPHWLRKKQNRKKDR